MTYIDHGSIKAIQTRLADYEMRVIHADGVYRHLYFHSTTDPFPGNCSFEVVTWPNHAVISGDWCPAHTIAREPDMLESFLNVSSIDHRYWAEKMRLTSNVPLTQPSEREYKKWVHDRAQELVTDYSLSESDAHDIVNEYMDLMDPDHPNIVDWEKLENLELLNFGIDDGCQSVVEVPLAISDAWELTFSEYTYPFLVACEGLHFAAKKWEEYKKTTTHLTNQQRNE